MGTMPCVNNEQSLSATNLEIRTRKSAGQTLDQAIAKQRTATRAKLMSEEQVQEAKDALILAERALETATEAESAATAETARVRASIAEAEESPEPAPSVAVSSPILMEVYAVLQNAGVQFDALAQVARLLGGTVPLTPPLPTTCQPVGPFAQPVVHKDNTGNAPPAVLQHFFSSESLPGVPTRKVARNPARTNLNGNDGGQGLLPLRRLHRHSKWGARLLASDRIEA